MSGPNPPVPDTASFMAVEIRLTAAFLRIERRIMDYGDRREWRSKQETDHDEQELANALDVLYIMMGKTRADSLIFLLREVDWS